MNIDTQLYIELLESEVYRLRGLQVAGRDSVKRQGASVRFGLSPAEAAERLEEERTNENRNR